VYIHSGSYSSYPKQAVRSNQPARKMSSYRRSRASQNVLMCFLLLFTTLIGPLAGSPAIRANGASILGNVSAQSIPGATCQSVGWASLQNITVLGSTASKTNGANNTYDAGAISWQTITSGQGYVQVIVDATDATKIFGLGIGNSNSSSVDIDFGMLLRNNGTLGVMVAGGNIIGNPGNYSVGDMLKVAVEYDATLGRNVIRYYRNTTSIFTISNPTITYPLLLDSSFNSLNSKLVDAKICAANLSNPTIPTYTTKKAVEWNSLVDATTSVNSIIKTGGANNNYNSGAISRQTIVTGEGSVQITVDVTNTKKVFGLGIGNSNAGATDIDFGLELRDNGTLGVMLAGGNIAATPGNYSVGDILKVAVEYDATVGRNVVRCYRNGTRLWTHSNPTLTYPLVLDFSIYTLGARFKEAYISGQNVSNEPIPISLYSQPVDWVDLAHSVASGNTLTGSVASGNTLTKMAAGNAYNGGATSWQQIPSGTGYVQVSVDVTNTAKTFGLANGNTNAAATDIDFPLALRSNGTLEVTDRVGNLLAKAGNYSVGDFLKVAVEYEPSLSRNVVRYYRNSTRLYTVTNPTIVYPLLLDTSIYHQGAKFINAIISAPNLNTPTVDQFPANDLFLGVQAGGSSHPYYPASNAVDGNTSTWWQDFNVGNRHISVTLPKSTSIHRIRILHSPLGGCPSMTLTGDGVQYSFGGSTGWNDLEFVPIMSNTFDIKCNSVLPPGGAAWTIASLEAYSGNNQPTQEYDESSFGGQDGSNCNGSIPGHIVGCVIFLDPVNMATGNFVWHETDLSVSSPGVDFDWSRTYNSLDTRSGLLGTGWSLTYDAFLDLSVTGQITAVLENGARSVYKIYGSNIVSPRGELATLELEGGGTYKLLRPDQSILRFSSTGKLISMSDSASRTLNLTYTSNKLSSVTDTAGRVYNTATDTQGRVTELTDVSLQRSAAYTYTGSLLSEVRDILGQTTQYNYTNGLLTSITLPDGNVKVQNQYDSDNRVIWQDAWNTTPFTITYGISITETSAISRTLVQNADGQTITFDHDAANRLLRTVDQAGNTTYFTRNQNQQLMQAIDAQGNTTNISYDVNGNQQAITDASGRRVEYTFDSSNHVTSSRDTLGNTTSYSYTTEGLLRQVTNPLLQTTTYTYTQSSQQSGGTTPLLTSTEDALGRVTHIGYNDLGQVTTITNTLNQVTQLEIDDAGRITRVIDPSGVAICAEYNAANQTTASILNCLQGGPTTNSQNVRTEYGYDLLGRPKWERNQLGYVTRTFYNSSGQIEKTVAGCTLSGSPSIGNCDQFDPQTPELNRTTEYGYDGLGRQITTTDTLGVVTRTEYDDVNHPVKWINNYLANQLADATTNVTSSVEYDAIGRIIASIDPLGRRSVPRYDGSGNVLESTVNYVDNNPSTGTSDTDLISSSEYDEVGRPVTVNRNFVDGAWDPARPDEDQRMIYSYDQLGRLTSQIENYVDGAVASGEIDTDLITQYQYDAVGNQTAVIDPLGRVTVTTYDGLNRAVQTVQNCTDGAGHAQSSSCSTGHGTGNDENILTARTYNARGLAETTTDQLGRVTRTTYDGLARPIQIVRNEGGTMAPADVTTRYGYEYLMQSTIIVGYTNVMTDAEGGVTRSEFNTAGWLTRSIDATNRAMNYTHDGLGRQTIQTDELGHETHIVYDALGRATKRVMNWQNGIGESGDAPDEDLIQESIYDEAGRKVASNAVDGKRTNYTYDNLNNLLSVVENVNGTISPADVTTDYSYDKMGRLTKVTDALNHQRGRTYNTAGWLISETDPLTRTTTYGYDRAGRLISTSDPRPKSVNYAYDTLDRLTSITASGLQTITMQYDEASRRTSLMDVTGTTTFTYDGLSRLMEASQSVDGDVLYDYDLVGRRTGISTSTGAPSVTYDYDQAGRLTQVNRGGSTHATATFDDLGRLESITRANGAITGYSYDGVNRTGLITTAVGSNLLTSFGYDFNRGGQVITATESITSSTRTIGYNYDGLLRLVNAKEQPGNVYTYTYDLVGNRTQVQVNGLTTGSTTYDAADQVVGWSYDGAGNLLSDSSSTYTYDPLRRLTSVVQSGITTTYGYNGESVLTSEIVSGIETRFTLDITGGLPENLGSSTGVSSTWFIRGWGQELSSGVSGTGNWYLNDRLGSVRTLVDNTGSVITGFNYDSFGTSEGIVTPQDYGFTGEYQSSATGLINLRARWYDSAAGAFLSVDPARNTTRQTYIYAGDDPVNNTDPAGLSPVGQVVVPTPITRHRPPCGQNEILDSEGYCRYAENPNLPLPIVEAIAPVVTEALTKADEARAVAEVERMLAESAGKPARIAVLTTAPAWIGFCVVVAVPVAIIYVIVDNSEGSSSSYGGPVRAPAPTPVTKPQPNPQSTKVSTSTTNRSQKPCYASSEQLEFFDRNKYNKHDLVMGAVRGPEQHGDSKCHVNVQVQRQGYESVDNIYNAHVYFEFGEFISDAPNLYLDAVDPETAASTLSVWAAANYVMFTNRDFDYAVNQFYERGKLVIRLTELMMISDSE
jgi:RHS repeat-associated protein